MNLRRVLPLFVLPTGVILGLIAVGTIRRRRGPLVAAFLLFFVCSLPVVGTSLVRLIEGGAERRVITDVGPADAVVVLSAGRTLAPGPGRVSEWGEANRYHAGLELFQAGKAPRLVFTGGPVGPEGVPTEGETLAEYARRAGVPTAAIVITDRVGTTEDEARETARVLAPHGGGSVRILLVTSAFHMERAVMLFERAGFEVDPFPVDFAGRSSGFHLQSWLPQSAGFARTELALRELIGRGYYSVRHWF